MKKKTIICLLLILGLNFSDHIMAQISYGGEPITLRSSHNMLRGGLNQNFGTNTIFIPDLNKVQIQRELDDMRGSCESCRSSSFYGKEVELNINFFEEANSYQTEDSIKVWTLHLSSNEAEGFQLIFNNFRLAEGSRMFVYNEDKTMILGAFTSKNNRDCNTFITQNINGNSIYIEYSEPLDSEGSMIMLEKVVYIFSKCFRSKGPFVEGDQGAASCQINTSCPQGNGYDIEIKSTALILIKKNNNYWGHCSGVLINDGNNYFGRTKPFFLTANHCYEMIDEKTGKTTFSDPKNWLFLFRHEASTCNSNGSDVPNNTTKSALGASILLRDEQSASADYMLLELNNNITDISKYDVVFAGYDYNDSFVPPGYNFQPIIAVHHPKGDVKKISISTNPAKHSGWNQEGDNYWDVSFTTGFKTEPGSSGSPLFNNEHRVVGICSGDVHTITCNDPQEKWKTLYGKLSKAQNAWIGSYLFGYTSDHFIFPTDEPTNPNPTNFKLKEYFITNLILNEPIQIDALITNLPIGSEGTKVRWELRINKYPGDFKSDYLCSESDFVHCETGYSEIFRYDKYAPSTVRAKYKFRNVILDAKGYYYTSLKISTELNNYEDVFERILYINIDDRKNRCIDVDLEVYNPKKKYALGESIWIKEVLWFKDTKVTNSLDPGPCHGGCEIVRWSGYSVASQLCSPHYLGVGKLSWEKNGITLETESYTTIAEYSDIFPGVYYEPIGYREFSLDSPGLNTIVLKVFLGNFNGWILTEDKKDLIPNPSSSQFYIDESLYSDKSSSKSVSFIVADCSGHVVISSINDPLLSLKESMYKDIGKGTIEIQNVKFEDGKHYEVEAYETIILKPGTVIKEGTSFHAKINPICLSSNSSSLRSSIVSNSDEEFEEDKITAENNRIFNVNEEIRIYPNVTTGIVNIIISDNSVINSVKIYDMWGRLLYNNSNFGNNSILDLSYFNEGMYILKIFSNVGETNHKIIKRK
ncbi:MAG: T9SS type A sorting domain-containing protein [Dysgonamonadaceae bacterium]|jgi:hypothetical protein|nr:T9SS type A sorting domain-containing protein [Dysgonamonadaceae bacterium]